MANRVGIRLQQHRLSYPTGLFPCLPAVAFSSLSPFSRRIRAPRRVLLGVGFSFLSQFINMSAGSIGAKSFIASARQKGAIEKVLENVEWPDQFPFKEEDFQRFDETSDTSFYDSPRFVTHIDDPAIAALTKYYSDVFPPRNTPGVSMLDMCSSWVSHYPKDYKQARIVGMGMNEEELKRNPVLTEYVVQDLNIDPKLPFEDNTFDIITNVVSVDYLTKPIEVFMEISRILKPGGLTIMSFSNRCFWTKAISIWTSTGDADHAMIVGAYFHYAGGFETPKCARLWISLPILVEQIPCTARNAISPNQNHRRDDEHNVGLPPFLHQVSEQASFARSAVIAVMDGIVAPKGTVHVGCFYCIGRATWWGSNIVNDILVEAYSIWIWTKNSKDNNVGFGRIV